MPLSFLTFTHLYLSLCEVPARGGHSLEKAGEDAWGPRPLPAMQQSYGMPSSGQTGADTGSGGDYVCTLYPFFTRVLCRLTRHCTERSEDGVRHQVNALS